jgi:DNA-binding transcriptional MerR regulator
MRPPKIKDCYWAQDVADKFGISKKTLYEWEEKGKVSKAPRDWRGWRMYNEGHLKQVKSVMEEKRRRVR